MTVKEKIGKLYNLSWRQSLLFYPMIFLLLFILLVCITFHSEQQFSLLAKSFLHLKLYFLPSVGGVGMDPVIYGSHIYWSEGLFAAAILTPFVAITSIFHVFFYQGYLSSLLTLGVIFFIFKLSNRLGYNNEDSLLWALVFALGSVFIGVVALSGSWYYEQVLTTFLLFWSLYEFFCRDKTRWWVLGIISALILLTRVSAAPIFIFFFLELVYLAKNKSNKWKLNNFFQLFFPMVGAVTIIGLYNFLRFHNVLQTGFKYELLSPISVDSRNLGILSVTHLPANLYSLLLRAPLPVLRNGSGWSLKFPFIQNNDLGISMLITSPYLLYLFTIKRKEYQRQHWFLLIAALFSLIAVALYFGIGKNQYGYRYQLDFLPLLFYVLMSLYRNTHKKISFGMKSLLIFSIVLNFYLVLTFIY